MSTGTSINARILAIAAIALAACESKSLPELGFARECDGRNLGRCDIRQADCRQVYLEFTACLRDRIGAPMPAVELITPAQLEEVYAVPTSTAALEELDVYGHALALADLIDNPTAFRDGTAQPIDNIAGFYDFRTKMIAIVDRGRPLDSPEVIATLVHEGVHAMQDAEHDLAGLYAQFGDDTDRSRALRAIIEGEAKLIELFLTLAWRNLSIFEGSFNHPAMVDQGLLTSASAASPFSVGETYIPYLVGQTHLIDAWLNGQQPAVDELFTNPPRSTAQIMSPYSVDPSRSSTAAWAPDVDVEISPPEGLEDYRPELSFVLGRWYLEVSLRRTHYPEAIREPVKDGAEWFGDKMYVFRRPSDRSTAILWLIRLRTPAAASNLAGHFAAAGPGYRSTIRTAAQNEWLIFTAAEDESQLEAWLAAGKTALLTGIK